MSHYRVSIRDSGRAGEQLRPVAQPKRDEYRVLRAIFKNGRPYEPGESVPLDAGTAARFKATGDIE